MARARASRAVRLAAREEQAPSSPPPLDAIRLAEFARCLYGSRRLRDGLFPPRLFGEPAWDILLDLYAAETEGDAIDVSSACLAAAVPQTTALRYIARLETAGLVLRTRVETDRRRSLLTLTKSGRATVESVLVALCGTWWTKASESGEGKG
jgi:DNA-binding MarR family transcriptional regulator